jgi:environmental stress-induced protein Ves
MQRSSVPYGLVVKPATWAKQPWKNGRGVTHEVWRWADNAAGDGFDLRLSVASIDGPQEFSLFPGYWRALVPLDESELTLAGSPLIKHRVVEFSGAEPVSAGGAGATRDLNVMSCEARRRAHVEISRATAPGARHLAAFALTPATVRDAEGREQPLDPTDTWILLNPPAGAAFTASAPVVWILF